MIAVDRLDPEPPAPWHERDRDLAGRLVEQWDRVPAASSRSSAPHTPSAAPGTLADLLDVDGAMFDYGSEIELPAGSAHVLGAGGAASRRARALGSRACTCARPAFDHGVISFLWALFFGLLIWIGGAAVGFSSVITFIVGCVAGFLIFLFVRVYGEDEPRRP